MKTEYRYVHFVDMSGDEYQYWNCVNTKHGDILGFVAIYDPWNQWCYFPGEDVVYSSECLDDIADFLRQLNDGDKPKIGE